MIDTHVHFWQLDRGEYAWISDARPTLNRDYLPKDFQAATHGTEVTASIAVQAAPTEAETTFLLDLADTNDWIEGVTGWIDLTDANLETRLDRLASRPKLKGIRPMAGVQRGEEWLATPEYEAGFAMLQQRGLILEALALPYHVSAVAQIAQKHSDLALIINHAAKPEPHDLRQWIADIKSMATLKNIHCKVSGFTQQSPSPDHHARVFETLLETFGPSRLLWGSDFPVLRETAEYRDWLRISDTLWSGLSDNETTQIKSGTARTLYKLKQIEGAAHV